MATTIPSNANKIVSTKSNNYFKSNKITIGSAIPTTGTYTKGDLILSSSPSSSAIGWICTATGTPGSWKTIKSGTDVTSIAWNKVTNKPSTFAPTLGTTSSTAFRGDYGNTAYEHSQSDHAPANAQKNSDITKAEIEAKLTGTITTHTHKYAGSSAVGGVATEAAKVSNSLQISGNGGLLGIYDGSEAKIINITPSVIGAATSDHKHDNIMSKGILAAQTKNTRPTESGISMQNAANNGYPSTYGNIINLKGDGDGQIFVGWSGTSGAHAPVYVRSRRDVVDANWSDWAQFYTTANKPKASDIGAAASTHSHTSMGVNDTRNDNEDPTALCANRQIRADFKMPGKINLTGSSASYVGTITFRPFGSASDWSGGKATQLAFADEGKVFMRKGTGTTWSDWTQFYTTANKPTASDIGAATESYVNTAIDTALGDVATILQEINGE